MSEEFPVEISQQPEQSAVKRGRRIDGGGNKSQCKASGKLFEIIFVSAFRFNMKKKIF